MGATKAYERETFPRFRCNTIRKHVKTLVARHAHNIFMVANKPSERAIGHPI